MLSNKYLRHLPSINIYITTRVFIAVDMRLGRHGAGPVLSQRKIDKSLFLFCFYSSPLLSRHSFPVATCATRARRRTDGQAVKKIMGTGLLNR